MLLIVRYFFLSIVIITFFKANSNAQEIKHLDFAKLRGTIQALEKDSLGYMWIGTSVGLFRYSGYEMKSYGTDATGKQPIKNVPGLLNHSGKLWALETNGKLLEYRYQQNDFVEVLNRENAVFNSICALSESKLLIGLRAGLLIFDLNSQQASELLFPEMTFPRLIRMKRNQVYVATSKGIQVFSYMESENKLIKEGKYLKDVDVLHFAFDDRKRVWAGTEKNGLFLIDGEETKSIPIELNANLQKNYAIRSIEFNHEGHALISVDRLGVFEMNASFEVVNLFQNDPDQPNSISQNSIYEIYVDKNNVYWLGSREDGIDQIYPKSNPFINFYHIQNQPNSLHDNKVRSILKDAEDNIWFGTENGISRRDAAGNWKDYSSNPGLKKTAVLTLDQYHGKLIFGAYGEGLKSMDRATEKIAQAFQSQQKPALKFIFATYTEGNDLWIGGNDGPLSHFRDNTFLNSYSVGMVKSITGGSAGYLYAGSDFGLYEINKSNQSVQKLTTPENKLTEIYDLCFDAQQQTLWVGTYTGLFKYNTQNATISKVNDPLAAEMGTVYSIQKDQNQHLWLGTISGLWRYNINNNTFRKFTREDGVEATEFGIGASARFADGTLAFGGPEGAVIFDPANLKKEPVTDQVFVSDFRINGALPAESILDKDINFTDGLELGYEQNSLSFTFEVVRHFGSKNNTFKWQLKGFDEKPIVSNSNRTAAYSNLNPGEYVMEATAFNADGVEGPRVYRIPITINNPFWKTWPAFVLYALILGAFLVLFFLATRARIERKIGEEKIKFFIDVAHDIRTPVSLIQLLANQLSDTKDLQNSIELILRNSRNLNEYVNQLLDFQKASRNQLELAIEEVDVKKLIDRVVADFFPLLVEKSIDVTTSMPNTKLWMDKNKMQRIFYNLISNAIKYSESGGLVKVELESTDDTVKIHFIDNGIGIPESQQKVIFSRFSRGTNVSNKGIPGSGIGLMLSKKIVELHHGKILLESKEHIGSTFTVQLKKGTAHYEPRQLVVKQNEQDKLGLVDEIIGNDKLVLLVEDNEDLRESIRAELEKTYKVITAPNGKEGLVLALDKNPDLIITDVMMPVMDGKEFCKVIKTNFKTSHIPVIMVTALQAIDEKIEGLEMGADAYVEKPFNMEVLKATVNNLLKSRQTIQQVIERNKVKDSVPKSPDETFLSQAVDLIKQNLENEEFTIETLCQELGLSRSNFFRKLKGLTSMGPSDLIMTVKIQHAEELLKSFPEMRITDVAMQSGFKDPKYFSTVFKKQFGKTPKEFVAEAQGKSQ